MDYLKKEYTAWPLADGTYGCMVAIVAAFVFLAVVIVQPWYW